MPTPEKFVDAMLTARRGYIRCLKEAGHLPQDYEPYGLIDVLQEDLERRKAAKPSGPVSIADFERLRDELRDVLPPGAFRHGFTRLRRKEIVVPIRGTGATGKNSPD